MTKTDWLQLHRRSSRILQTLINPHDIHPSRLDRMDKLPEIRHRAGTQVVHDGQVASAQHIPRKSVQLTLRGVRVGPQPVFDIDAPVDNVGIGDLCGEALPETCSHGSVWGSEVSRWLVSGRAFLDTRIDWARRRTFNPQVMTECFDTVHNLIVDLSFAF